MKPRGSSPRSFLFRSMGNGPFANHGAGSDGHVTIINPSAVKGIDIFLQLADAFPETSFAAVPTWSTTPDDVAVLKARRNVKILPPVENY